MVGMGIKYKRRLVKMYNFKYVTKMQLSPVKQDLIQIINSVQKQVRKDFTFQFYFVGSVGRNMVTYDVKSNVGFDFDVDIYVNDDERRFSAKEIKTKIRLALDNAAPCFGYDNAEDSTRVITIKFKDRENSKILHSCDVAIVNNYIDGNDNERQKYIHYNKKQNKYSWQEQPQGFYLLDEKADWIKNNEYWQQMRDLYLDKKNRNSDQHKYSRSIYAEAIHEICQKYGYYNK